MAAAMLSVGVYTPVYASETGETETLESLRDPDAAQTEAALAAAGFCELDDIVLTADQIDSKINLASHAGDLEGCVAGEDYVPNEIVVEADDEDTAAEYAGAYNAELVAFEYGKALLELKPEEADLDGFDTDMVALAVELSSDTDVNLPAAWPNYIDEFFEDSYDYTEFDDFSYEYNDPQLSRITGTGSETSVNDMFQWHHEILDSNAAWRAGYKGQGVNVVVIDSGINEHEDITWDGAERLVIKSDGSAEVTDDVQAVMIHGTPVSGLIRGTAGNGLGGAGIAPECSLYMIRIDDNGTPDTYTEAVAIDRAVEVHDADVINLSLGGIKYTDYYEKSVKAAYERGAAVVCAAGNYGTGSVTYPASYEGSIAVAGTTRSNTRYPSSNYGSMIRYAAPGSGVVVAYDGSYAKKNGTSFSAPIISGMMAVVLGSGKITSIGRQRVDDALKLLDKSCTYIGDGSGRGIPSLARALGLDSGDSTPGLPRADVESGVYEKEELAVGLMTENSASSHADVIFYSDDGKDVSFANGTPSANAKKYDPAEKITITGKRITVIKAIAVNPATGIASDQVSFKYTLKPLVSDIVITTDTGSYTIQRGKYLTLTSKCLPDYAGNPGVSYEVTSYPDGADGGNGLSVKGNRLYAAASAVPGRYTVACRANDRGHFSKTFDVIVVSPDRTVSSISLSKTSLTIYAGMSDDVDIELVTVKGGEKYIDRAQDYSTWSSNSPDVATASINGNTLTIDAKKAGSATIKGVSNDGAKVTRSISVKVLQHPESVKITGVTGDRVAAGKSVKLSAAVLPEDTTDRSIVWSIVDRPAGASDKTTASINPKTGVFSAKKAVPGIYTVRASAKDKDNLGNVVYDDYRIEVSQVATTAISLARNSTDIYRVGNTYGSPVSDSIEVMVTGGSMESVSLVNSDPGLVSARLSQKDGALYLDVEATANSAGTCRIKVLSNDGTGKYATCTVNVINPPSYLELSNPLLCSHLAKGKSVKLTPKFGNAYGKLSAKSMKLVWTSTDPDVLSVDQKGKVTAKSELGRAATITARTMDGVMSCSVRLTSVAAVSSMTAYGPLIHARRGSGSGYYWSKAGSLKTDNTYYLSLENTTDADGRQFSSFSVSYCDVSVDKQGLAVRWNKVGADRDIDSSGKTLYSDLSLYPNKPGTYHITIRMRDGSKASKKIKVIVKE